MSGECRCDCAVQGPVIVGEGWPVDLAAEHVELVAHHDDLKVLAPSGTDHKASRAGPGQQYRMRCTRLQGRSTFPLVNIHDRIVGPHTSHEPIALRISAVWAPTRFRGVLTDYVVASGDSVKGSVAALED